MMRIAWFSPFPPVRTGIARDSAMLVAALRPRGYTIDTYPAESAHDFPWRHRRHPYDLVVYQFGNSSHHDYAWAYALRYPGLVVMHDTHVHHARAAFLLRERRAADYRAEFRFNHPGVSPDVAELAIAGFDNRLYYDWPMTRALVASAKLVAVHGEGARRQLGDAAVSIRLGHGEEVSAERRRDARARIRAQYGIPQNALLFICAGGISPEKRIPQVLAALAAIRPFAPHTRLLLAGATAAHYDLASNVQAHHLQDAVTIAGYVESDAALTDHIAAADVSLNLRWPTAGETSGPWLRALGAGVPTVITDLAHLGAVPSLDPRTWTANATTDGRMDAPAVTVAIDIIDEDHSLRLAMRRLAADPALRESLGRSGADYWRREHSEAAMIEDYERMLPIAAARPDPLPALPAHMRDSGERTLGELLGSIGVERPW